ncbi:heterokaryon incompatibility protein [Colletotrichum kahawae]|uniref:Heterokaryon incompatibility protein n=1 Tax=Colletotrichum kahawae TaxID=34407 RepID=A0AAD9YQJ5_COLKA|nr:heterokaryon incompatibility protein [Colletotrichum kahawae]
MGPKTQLHVTTSCAMALRRLRLAEATRTLWVDAICIDQSSVAERNHQMTLMTRIYHAASRVIVYLGEPALNDDSDAVMDWVQDLHAPSDRIERPIRPKQAAFQSFLGRRWFTRVWVMQEIRVAKAAIVICGGKTISWDAFRQVKHTFSYSFRHAEPLPYTVQSLTSTETFGRYSWKPSYPVLLLRLLERTRDFDATDARDKLFAILPLLDWETQQCLKANPDGLPSCQTQSSVEIIRVDYSRSTAEMFTQLSRVLIDAIGLDVL